jgi:Gram-negative bacterial TonB protein C-terminal
MTRRPPMAWVAGVLAVHLALLAALAHHRPPRHTKPGLDRRQHARLIVVDASQGSTPSTPTAADGRATVAVPVQAPAAPASVTTANAPPAAHDAASAAATPPAAASSAYNGGDGVYRPPSALYFPVRPRSAPDLSVLDGVPWSGMPLRVRLFIDTDGAVVDVQVLQSQEQDELLQRIRKMFLATGFTPGMQDGKPVPCYKDIEFTVGPPS